jgi:DNA repair exonuclease SbcCD ATPase subunit
MRLTLNNFCCWEQATFEFPDTGTVLLAAPSGTGKTSIIRALIFALFGQGQKVARHGTKKCMVRLETHGMVIERQKGPGRLRVNDTLEDDEAQAYIDERFSSDMFYLEQGGRQTFLHLNPKQKLSYLEQLAVSHTLVHPLKEALHDRGKQLDQTMKECQTRSSTLTYVLDSSTVPEPVDEPSVDWEIVQESKTSMDQEWTQLTHRRTTLQAHRVALDQYQKNLNRFQASIEQGTQSQQELVQQLEILPNLQTLTEQLTRLDIQRQQWEQWDQFQQCLKEQHRMESLFQSSEWDEVQTQVHLHEQWIEQQSVSLTQWKQWKQIRVQREQLQQEKQSIPIVSKEELDSLTHQIHELKQTLTHPHYTCPHCNQFVRLRRQQLEPCSSTDLPSGSKSQLKQQVVDLEQSLVSKQSMYHRHETIVKQLDQCTFPPEYTTYAQLSTDELDLHIREWQEHQRQLTQCQTELRTLESHRDRIEKSLSQLRQQLTRLEMDCPTGLGLTDIQTQQEDLQRQKMQRTEWERQLDRVTRSLKRSQQQLDQLICPVPLNDTEDQLCQEESHLRTRQMEWMTLEQQWMAYRTYCDACEERTRLESERAVTNEKALQAQQQGALVKRLQRLVLEAEGLAVAHYIETINSHLEGYLQRFFPDSPLSARLVRYKQSKSTKQTSPSIQLELIYNGYEVDLQTLSGGEQDRLALAFTLVLAELEHAPFLLLDECVSSLDQETATLVLDVLQDQGRNRLCVLIAHQIVTGRFNHVIHLNSQSIHEKK